MKAKALKFVDKILNDVVTLASIGAIAFLAYNGIADVTTFGIIAGLGGYSAKRRSEIGAVAGE